MLNGFLKRIWRSLDRECQSYMSMLCRFGLTPMAMSPRSACCCVWHQTATSHERSFLDECSTANEFEMRCFVIVRKTWVHLRFLDSQFLRRPSLWPSTFPIRVSVGFMTHAS